MSMRYGRHIAVAAIGLGLIGAASCKREIRQLRVSPPMAVAVEGVPEGELFAGATARPAPVKNGYDENAHAITEGQRLFTNMNCAGCHFHGGGGIGPPLMDDKWIYGSDPDQIYATVVQGRPNGMPSFRGKLQDFQVWEIVAYVRSMSGLASLQAAPGRTDDMSMGPAENSRKPVKPVQSFEPPSAEGRG